MSIFMILFMFIPKSWGMDSLCTMTCYKSTIPCIHTKKFADMPGFELAVFSTKAMISILKFFPGVASYKLANLVVYFGLVPAIALFNAWLQKEKWYWYAGGIGSVIFLLVWGQLFWKGGWYYFCVEFCIRLGNLLGVTYHGICFFIFIVAIPLVLILDFLWGIKKYRMHAIESNTLE